MRTIIGLFVALLSTSCFGQSVTETPRPDALQVVAQEKAYVLSVPVSRLVMFIPRGKLAPMANPQGGAASSPRYFYFVDRAFNVSGWFEPAQNFSGMQKFWEDEKQAWSRKGLPEPKDVTFRRIEGWDTVIYDTPSPLGNNSHIRAHWVQAGTWIDIHLSLASNRPASDIRSVLETFLKAVFVKERSQ